MVNIILLNIYIIILKLNTSSFASKIPDMYPPELDHKKTTESPTAVYYLDILITINNGKYVTAVHNIYIYILYREDLAQ